MPLLKPRNRSIVFRLSEEEYQSLQTACVQSGGRSISEFTRTTLLSSIGNGHAQIDGQIREIHAMLQSLTLLVARSQKS